MTRWILFLALAFTLASCKLDMKSSEMLFRHDPKEDTMRVLFVHRDITAKGAKDGAQQLQKLLTGERTFMLGFWPFFIELDERVQEADARLAESRKAGAPDDESDLLTLVLAKRVRVVETKLGTDVNGALVGWQEVVISEWSKFLSDLNRRAATSMYKDLSLDGDGCVSVGVILSAEEKIRALREITKSDGDPDYGSVNAILDNLVDVATTADGIRLKFGKARGAAVGVRVDATSDPNKKRSGEDQWLERTPEDRARLNEALKAEGVVLDRVDADAKIRSITGEKTPVDDAK